MMQKLNAVLLIIALVGALLAAGKIREVQDLKFEKQGLIATVGDLRVSDSRDTCLINVTGDRTFFHWRVHIPKGRQIGQRVITQTSLSRPRMKTFGQAEICDYVCSFRFSPKRTQMYVRSHGGSGLYDLATNGESKFLEKYWSKLDFQFVSDKKTRVVEGDELIQLLEIEVPDELMDEYRKACPKKFSLKKVIARIHLGGPSAMVKLLTTGDGDEQ